MQITHSKIQIKYLRSRTYRFHQHQRSQGIHCPAFGNSATNPRRQIKLGWWLRWEIQFWRWYQIDKIDLAISPITNWQYPKILTGNNVKTPTNLISISIKPLCEGVSGFVIEIWVINLFIEGKWSKHKINLCNIGPAKSALSKINERFAIKNVEIVCINFIKK